MIKFVMVEIINLPSTDNTSMYLLRITIVIKTAIVVQGFVRTITYLLLYNMVEVCLVVTVGILY